jgi:Cys-rich protein (TIGR01571 family)
MKRLLAHHHPLFVANIPLVAEDTYNSQSTIGSMMASSEEENTVVDAEQKIAMIKKTWQLLAPASYPAGRKIEAVTPEGNIIFVRVPDPGVYRGNTFVGEEIPKPAPVMESWHDGICNCGSEGSFCSLAFCFPALAWGYIMDKIGFSFLGYINPSLGRATFAIMVGATILFMLHNFSRLGVLSETAAAAAAGSPDTKSPEEQADIAAATPWMDFTFITALMSWYLIILFALTRRAIRKMYKIRGNCCTDCLWVWCCPCCTPLQLYRHMRRSGDQVSGCDCGGGKNHQVSATEIV